MDGVKANDRPVIVLAATNLPDQIDGAILDRFTSRIEIPLPEDTEPPDLQPGPQLELAVPTQMPDLPPPVFPAPRAVPVVARKDPPPIPGPAPPKQALVRPPAPNKPELVLAIAASVS